MFSFLDLVQLKLFRVPRPWYTGEMEHVFLKLASKEQLVRTRTAATSRVCLLAQW